VTFRDTRDAHLERIHDDDGWMYVLFVDGRPKAHIGPVRYKSDLVDLLAWIVLRAGSLEVVDSELTSVPPIEAEGAWFRDLEEQAERHEGARHDLTELVQQFDQDPERFREENGR
jgi:hypothetical protein